MEAWNRFWCWKARSEYQERRTSMLALVLSCLTPAVAHIIDCIPMQGNTTSGGVDQSGALMVTDTDQKPLPDRQWCIGGEGNCTTL